MALRIVGFIFIDFFQRQGLNENVRAFYSLKRGCLKLERFRQLERFRPTLVKR